MPLTTYPYNRERAAAYAAKWAYNRNPRYYDFEGIGGDCTNFVSQCIYSGTGVMNYTPTYGWYYIAIDRRTPSWTGVTYLYDFLTSNEGVGPFGREVDIDHVQLGDVVQLIIEKEDWQHTAVVTHIHNTPSPRNIYVSSHSYDTRNKRLSDYAYTDLRFLHISGYRHMR